MGAQCRNQVVVQKKFFLKKSFPKQLKMVKRKKLYEHVRIHPAINHKKHCIANFSSFAVIVDVTDILQTSKHNFQFRAKHVEPWHAEEKYFCLDIMEVVIGFSMLKKAKNETQKRTRMTCQRRANMSKKKNMSKKSKHVKKEKHAEKAKKGERRQRRKGP